MTQNNNILQELNELKSILAKMTPQNAYTVPEGYFDALAELVLNRIKAIEAVNAAEELSYLSPTLEKFSKEMPYALPDGYFEGLEENLMQSVRESNDYHTAKEELETLSPLLSGLKKQTPFSVPQGYFENLAVEKPETKIVSLTGRKWFRYAAAAMVTGAIALAGFLLFGNKQNTGKSLARFENKLNKEIKKLSDEELKDFIQYTDAGLNGQEKVYNEPKIEAKDLLKDVPDSELKEFLEETADPDISDEGTTPMN